MCYTYNNLSYILHKFYHLEERRFQTSPSISQVFDQKKNIIQHIEKHTQIIETGLVMILHLFVCRVAVSFVGRGLLGDPIELPPSSSPGVSGDDVQPIRAHVFFLDLDFSFTRLGSQHLSFHPVF